MAENGYDKQDIRKAKAGSIHLSAVVGYNCRMLSKGKPDYNPKEDEYWDSLPGTTGKMKLHEFIIKHVPKAIEEGADKVEEAERKKKEEERREAMKKQSVFNNVCIVSLANDYSIEEFIG